MRPWRTSPTPPARPRAAELALATSAWTRPSILSSQWHFACPWRKTSPAVLRKRKHPHLQNPPLPLRLLHLPQLTNWSRIYCRRQ